MSDIYIKDINMKYSHRKGISLENEYGISKANDIRKKYSEAAKLRTYKEYTYTCVGCNNSFISNKQLVTSNKYCSEECQINKSNLKIVQCDQCSKSIKKRVYKDKKYYFCSRTCYGIWKKSNLIPPQNELRRINSNSASAIEKRRKTSIKSGIWHDPTIFVNGMSKKEYTKIVRRLTISKRQELQKIWDGTDYYTGEYIRDNFNLHWSHGDYPSVDHKISITEAMKLQLSPEQVCNIENLVYTKKRINSMKRALGHDKFIEQIKNKKH